MSSFSRERLVYEASETHLISGEHVPPVKLAFRPVDRQPVSSVDVLGERPAAPSRRLPMLLRGLRSISNVHPLSFCPAKNNHVFAICSAAALSIPKPAPLGHTQILQSRIALDQPIDNHVAYMHPLRPIFSGDGLAHCAEADLLAAKPAKLRARVEEVGGAVTMRFPPLVMREMRIGRR